MNDEKNKAETKCYKSIQRKINQIIKKGIYCKAPQKNKKKYLIELICLKNSMISGK